MRRIQAAGLNIAEHEVGQSAAGIGAVEYEGAARIARLFESDAAAGDVGAEPEEVLALLPEDRIGELKDGVGTVARADLALQVVHVEPPSGPLMQIDGGPNSSGSRETPGRPILPTTSIGRVVGGAEDFGFVEAVPARAQFVDQGRMSVCV